MFSGLNGIVDTVNSGDQQTGWASAVKDIFTKGLDSAGQVLQAKYRASDPTLNSVGPNGQVAYQGQRGTLNQQLSGVSPMLWIGGGVALIVLVIVLLKK